jgi:hypothetical protein
VQLEHRHSQRQKAIKSHARRQKNETKKGEARNLTKSNYDSSNL